MPHAPGEPPDVVTEPPENPAGPSLRWVAAVLVVWLVIVVVYITWQLARGSVA